MDVSCKRTENIRFIRSFLQGTVPKFAIIINVTCVILIVYLLHDHYTNRGIN
jgi:hypothetical protein